jgi:hypothetical protein
MTHHYQVFPGLGSAFVSLFYYYIITIIGTTIQLLFLGWARDILKH